MDQQLAVGGLREGQRLRGVHFKGFPYLLSCFHVYFGKYFDYIFMLAVQSDLLRWKFSEI